MKLGQKNLLIQKLGQKTMHTKKLGSKVHPMKNIFSISHDEINNNQKNYSPLEKH